MKKFSKVLALLLAAVMVLSLVSCGKKEEQETTKKEETTTTAKEKETTKKEENTTTAPVEEKNDTLVYVTSTFGQKFSPFFYTTAYDAEVVDMFTGYLLAADRGGAVINDATKGTTLSYNGTDYNYESIGAVEVIQNDDGTVDYKLSMRDDVKFSDGVGATIDDVIFGIYVCCDPTYDGSSTIYALPIKGMSEFREGMASRGADIFAAGPDGYKATENYTEAQYKTFWDYYNNNAGADFAKEICDYCISKGYNGAKDTVAQCAANWGFKLEDKATYQDFWDAIVAAYDTVEDAVETESAGSDLFMLTMAALGAEYEIGVKTGEGADYIEGIEKTGDYSMTVHMTEFDATAIYNMSFIVAPLHWYGNADEYDYEAHKFGFQKGDLSGVKSKTTDPLGCGPYVYKGYSNGTVTFAANETYYKGAPEIATVLFQEGVDADYVPGIKAGSFDIGMPSISADTVAAIKDCNSNGELVGDVITTYLVDYRGYGYMGINAELVKVGDDCGSEESKALRKGFMTLFSVYRGTVINSYYGDRAAVIQYPISNTSWAAPKPADEGYEVAYSTDADGEQIYTDDMTDEQKYEAAKEAAIGWFKAAGFTYDEAAGKFTDFTETYEVMIPGQGTQDHPAYGIAVAAADVLAGMGITLQVNDVGTSVWNNALEENTAMMWAAAWQSSVDPDMTQVYTSTNYKTGTNSNHYAVQDAELDSLIAQGRSSADTEERKSIYKNCFDIILDWGVELPTYQRKDCTTVSTLRVDCDTVPGDLTPYWGVFAEIEKLLVK